MSARCVCASATVSLERLSCSASPAAAPAGARRAVGERGVELVGVGLRIRRERKDRRERARRDLQHEVAVGALRKVGARLLERAEAALEELIEDNVMRQMSVREASELSTLMQCLCSVESLVLGEVERESCLQTVSGALDELQRFSDAVVQAV